MALFKYKPIEAIRYTGSNSGEVFDFASGWIDDSTPRLYVGDEPLYEGNWLVKVSGRVEIYTDERFNETFEPLSTAEAR